MLARQIVVGFGIAILFPMLIYYGVASITPPPRYADYHATIVMPPATAPEERAAYLEKRKREGAEWQLAQERYAKTLIVVMAPVGIAAMLIGYFLGVNAIGTGLLVGGLFCAVHGFAGYWAFLLPWMRFAAVLGGFLMLLFIGAKHIGFGAQKQPATNGGTS